MFKDSLAKYYQNNKERLQKKLVKDIKVFLNKKKKKRQYLLAEDKKQKPVEYRQKYYKISKNALF